MFVKFKNLCLASVCIAIVMVCNLNAQPPVDPTAQVELQPKVGPHGGAMQVVGDLRLETLVAQGGLRIFVYDEAGRPVDVGNARGLAMLKIEGNSKQYRYDLFVDTVKGQIASSLSAAVDLSKIAGREIELKLQIVGVPAVDKRGITLTQVALVPMTQRQAMAKQKICPISGQPLGSMGSPIAVQIGDQTIYVCCKGCIKPLKENPEKYLGKSIPRTSGKPVVIKATAEDAPHVAAQKLCPVMDEPLDAMGGPWKTVVMGKTVYLCCPGCAKMLHANPAEYFAKLAKQGLK